MPGHRLVDALMPSGLPRDKYTLPGAQRLLAPVGLSWPRRGAAEGVWADFRYADSWVWRRCARSPAMSSPPRPETTRAGAGERGVEAELQRYIVESQCSMARELADVEEDLRNWRRVVAMPPCGPFLSAMPVHAI